MGKLIFWVVVVFVALFLPGPPPKTDDTAATAHNLGDVTSAGIVQVAGAIAWSEGCRGRARSR